MLSCGTSMWLRQFPLGDPLPEFVNGRLLPWSITGHRPVQKTTQDLVRRRADIRIGSEIQAVRLHCVDVTDTEHGFDVLRVSQHASAPVLVVVLKFTRTVGDSRGPV